MAVTEYGSDLEARVAALEARVANPLVEFHIPPMEPLTDEQEADLRADLEKAMRQGPFTHNVVPRKPLLTPETARALLREYVTILQPGEVLVVRVPDWWTPNNVREAQEAFESMTEYRNLNIAILFMPGEEFAVAVKNAPEPETAG